LTAELNREKPLRAARAMSGLQIKFGNTCVQLLRGQHIDDSDSSYSCFDNVITASSNFDCCPDTRCGNTA
jgi:hypothetical protein